MNSVEAAGATGPGAGKATSASVVLFIVWEFKHVPGMLQFMGLQRVGHDCATELN